MSRRKFSIGRGLLAWAVLSIATTATYAQEARQRFDIPAQAASEALNAFSRQSGLRLLFPFEAVAGKQTQALSGELTAEEALEKLLAGSDLTFEITSSSVVLIREKSASKTGSNAAAQQSFLLAQNDERAGRMQQETPPAGVSQPTPESAQRGETQLVDIGEIVVTGTHIRGIAPTGSRLTLIDRNYIDNSGYATVKDILDTLPQNFSGGVTERLGTTDPQARNFNSGSAVNLRGLGVGATLVLVNGRRPAPGGFVGAFVDVSNIPSSAIERIEVLTDGASAIYGSDAIGGVVNIILRSDYDGLEARARYGTLDGDADEYQAALLAGNSWTSGNALFGYQFYKRQSLAFTDRSFSADSDQRPRGGDNFSSILSNPGNILDLARQPVFAIPAGQDGTSLTTADLVPGAVNFHNTALQNDLLPEQEMNGAFFSLSQDIGERSHLFAEGRYNVRDTTLSGGTAADILFVPDSNPFFFGDPLGFGLPFVQVGYNFAEEFGPESSSGESESYSGALGATRDVGNAWQVSVVGSYAEEKNRSESPGINFATLGEALGTDDPSTPFDPAVDGFFNPFGEGSNTSPAVLDAIRGASQARAVTDLWNANVKGDGPLFGLLRGNAKLAVGADYREEDFSFDSITQGIGIEDSSQGRGRRVSAVFAELALPFVGPDNATAGVRRLDVSLAGRYEDYSDFGTTFNPKIGLTWAPLESLQIRGTWGTSFKAPRLVELNEGPGSNFAFLLPVIDPQSPAGISLALLQGGNNENLQEETATTWTAGLDFTPAVLPGLALSLTYYDTEYEDRVVRPGPLNVTEILFEEEQWAEVINRNPSQEEVDALCNSPIYLGPPCAFSPPTVLIDLRLRNLAVTAVRAVDLNVDQTFDTPYGVFNAGLSGSYVIHFEQAASSTAPLVDVVDTLGNPLALRLRGTLSWNRAGLGAGATINYADSYKDTRSQPNRTIDSWTTLDLQASYRTAAGSEWLDDLTLALTAVNVFDEDPPFANQSFGYDPTNANAYGRLIAFQITKGW